MIVSPLDRLDDKPLSPDAFGTLEAFLIGLNATAAAVTLPYFRTAPEVENKASGDKFDPVTLADKGAEAAIRAAIAARFPDHGVIGEEYGEDRPDADFVWVIDPIDGTRAFIAGLPVWTTLIGLRYRGRPVLGSIGQPFLGEVFIGHAASARLISPHGERSLRVRTCEKLTHAVIATTDPDLFDGAELGAWRQVRAAARLARLGCDAYAYAMVALGALDMVIEAGLKSWDIDAAIPVIAGAGGLVTDWRGEPVGDHGGQIVITGDRRPLDEALITLRRSAK